ncbi:MAG: lytic murein transglycosylase [Pseudomonadota bacterium]
MSGFDAWLSAFSARAARQGVAIEPLQQATYLPEVIAKDRHQPETALSLPAYLARVVTDQQVEAGRAALTRYGDMFDRIEARYPVDRHIVAAIWGVESCYGAMRGDVPVLSALATLAYEGRRATFFEAELTHALRIIAEGHATADMRGSWAGAMGHTQFMPSSHRRDAVDADGDGRADIWGDDPTDALASTARYLARRGWQQGLPVVTSAQLSLSADLSQAHSGRALYPSGWAALGVTPVDAPASPLSLWLPAGAHGPAFLTSVNFSALRAYNASNAYALAVATLAIRLAGDPVADLDWPPDPPLRRAETRNLQSALTNAGFDTKGTDGLPGPNTTHAIRAYQRKHALPVDGHASAPLLARLTADSSTD